MALGKVTVNAANLAQGPFPDIEKYFLFIGEGPNNQNSVVFLNTDSDLDAEIGAGDLMTQLEAARSNAGQNWAAAAVPVADGTLWDPAADIAMQQDVRVEAIVICTPVAIQADLTAMQTKAMNINSTYGRRLFFIAAARPIDPTPSTGETWSEYITDLTDLTASLSAFRVSVVPKLFTDAVGIYAGRLCNDAVSVADSPMRVATGTLVGQDQSTLPVDTDGIPYTNAQALALNNQRFSVPQIYADYEGVYWSDGQMLDVTAGDYTVVENLRVVDKAARRVRIVLIALIADRRFNASPAGEAWAISKMMRPLFEMSRSAVFQGVPFPADLRKPKDGDILINWIDRTTVETYIKARPFESPKDITANIILDLSAPVA